MEKDDPRIKPGAVVQINPDKHDSFFKGCFMIVTDRKGFGAQGFIACPARRDENPKAAYYRAKWEEIEYIGQAQWSAESIEEERYEDI